MSTSELEENIATGQIPIIQITENGIEGFEILCRLCANRSDHLIPIYSEEGMSNDLSNKMNLYLPVKVSETDTLPLQCCYQCASTVLTWHELVIASVEADRRLRDLQIEAEKHLEEQNAAMQQAVLEQQSEIKSDSEDDRVTTALKINKTIKEILKKDYEITASNTESEESTDNKNIELLKIQRKTFKCTDCNKNFLEKRCLDRHLRIHQNERSFTCEKCGKQFRERSSLNRHMRDVHIGMKKFSCDLCSKSFAATATRDDHRRRHTLERPFICSTCGKTFACKASLYTHSKMHLNIYPFSCVACGRKFRRKQELKTHASIHSGEKPYICKECGKGFRIRTLLMCHLIVHSNYMPFECKICGQMYKQFRYLKNHMRNKHSLKSTDVNKEN